jgi:hypothetical protein
MEKELEMALRWACWGIPTFVLLSATWLGFSVTGQPPEQVDKAPRGNQLLMRDKLNFANMALEGLSTEKFDKIMEAGKMMGMISRAASWHVIPTPEYTLMSKNFQEQAKDLMRHAEEKNLDAASLDYMRITMTCVQCHKYMRSHAPRKE